MPTILIADDNDDLRNMLAQLLRADGYDVAEAADGSEAVSASCAGFVTKPVDAGVLLKTMRLLLGRDEGIAATSA